MVSARNGLNSDRVNSDHGNPQAPTRRRHSDGLSPHGPRLKCRQRSVLVRAPLGAQRCCAVAPPFAVRAGAIPAYGCAGLRSYGCAGQVPYRCAGAGAAYWRKALVVRACRQVGVAVALVFRRVVGRGLVVVRSFGWVMTGMGAEAVPVGAAVGDRRFVVPLVRVVEVRLGFADDASAGSLVDLWGLDRLSGLRDGRFDRVLGCGRLGRGREGRWCSGGLWGWSG